MRTGWHIIRNSTGPLRQSSNRPPHHSASPINKVLKEITESRLPPKEKNETTALLDRHLRDLKDPVCFRDWNKSKKGEKPQQAQSTTEEEKRGENRGSSAGGCLPGLHISLPKYLQRSKHSITWRRRAAVPRHKLMRLGFSSFMNYCVCWLLYQYVDTMLGCNDTREVSIQYHWLNVELVWFLFDHELSLIMCRWRSLIVFDLSTSRDRR